MIKFDSASIYNRALEMLKQDLDWKDIANDSVISSILKSNAEINAETARYAEYLFKESKWDTAQNTSSIVSMANMLGYRPRRNVSASGTLLVSTDSRIFNASNYANIENYISNNLYKNTSSDIQITKNSKIVDSRGYQYIAEQTTLSSSSSFVRLLVTQGIRKSIQISKSTIRNTYTTSKLNKYIYIPVVIENCENASSSVTKRLFRVFIDSLVNDKIVSKEYRVVSSLLFSTSGDYDVEVYNDIYNTKLFYLKFNNDISKGHVIDITQNSSLIDIRIEYVESLGSAGNLNTLYNRFTITGVSSIGFSGSLYGINESIISGGKDAETVDDIKESAPKYYMNNYTIGTKEAYENMILSLELTIEKGNYSKTLHPKKVSVYYGTTVENDNVVDATMVTFLSEGLDDLATSLSADDTYADINLKLDEYLSKIKSPQDRLIFKSPNYVSYALGIKYSLPTDNSVSDISSLTSSIQGIIDNKFGSNSDDLDFLQDYSASDIVNTIYDKYGDTVRIDSDITLEAIKRLSWSDAIRMCPTRTYEADTSSGTYLHTVRIPFYFDSLFAGEKTQKGFIDYRSNAAYTLRFDIMYNKEGSTISTDFNSSIFICDSNVTSKDRGEKTAYYVVRDSGSDTDMAAYWPGAINGDVTQLTADYEVLSEEKAIKISDSDCFQVPFRDQVFDDDQATKLKAQIRSGAVNTWTSSSVNRGCIENFLIYINPDYSNISSDSKMCEGFIEMDFESLCSVLNIYKKNIDTELLKCGLNNEIQDTWNNFISVCDSVIHIYVSMRPIDNSSVNISTNENISKNTVLYIDSHDSLGTYDNMFETKKYNRMISVQYKG